MSTYDLWLQSRGGCDEPDTSHDADSDCTVDPTTQTCTTCGEHHGKPCVTCGGRAYCNSDCPELLASQGCGKVMLTITTHEGEQSVAACGAWTHTVQGIMLTHSTALCDTCKAKLEILRSKYSNAASLVSLWNLGELLAPRDPFAGQAGAR